MKEKPNNLTTQVKIALVESGVAISSPFSASNNEKFRSRGGIFDSESGRWILPNTRATHDLIEELFGADSELVTASVPSNLVEEAGNQWQKGGYVIGTRFKHNGPVKTAPCVQLAKGNWLPSGGTVADPKVSAEPDVEIHITVRKSYADREGLTIIKCEGPLNPLENYSDEDLRAELRRREAA